ncbi:hypothetical protein C8Q69DRAFT_137405 [Paecilomyces variotii]|uniref:Uncharacterized protein n=1 Tax=Byssochlamys spectabilis TaxID=264951 RepID=A0A443I082_BYSSP|nr:hypothetical protein C8Q69DRAFT_137405 [Paecilomyces variotii]RWQ97461.1 hypothetical protein C8Q69DRAFT_137405 [Paecilomyces variotii]
MVAPKSSRGIGFETTSLRPRFYDCAQQGPLSQRRAISMLDSGREYLATSMVTMKKMRSRTLSTLRRKPRSTHQRGSGRQACLGSQFLSEPGLAPRTGCQELGGWTTRELNAILGKLTSLNIIGVEVVEVAPPYDDAGGSTVWAVADLIYEVSGL